MRNDTKGNTHNFTSALPKPTRREIEILGHLYEGMSSQAVADLLFIDKRTVDFHLSNLYRKWSVHSRTQAINLALREKFIVPS